MALIQQKDGWLPAKIHGQIPYVAGADIEATVVAALKKLMIPSQVPAYTDIKYQIKNSVTIAVSGKGKHTPKQMKANILVFELD
jgi:hypothetical protein